MADLMEFLRVVSLVGRLGIDSVVSLDELLAVKRVVVMVALKVEE